jgi:hypothetical protein
MRAHGTDYTDAPVRHSGPDSFDVGAISLKLLEEIVTDMALYVEMLTDFFRSVTVQHLQSRHVSRREANQFIRRQPEHLKRDRRRLAAGKRKRHVFSAARRKEGLVLEPSLTVGPP